MKAKIGKYYKRSNNRKINIEVDRFDTYSLDHTLSLIILPALVQLKQTMHGVPTDFSEVGGEDYHDQTCFDFYKEDQHAMFEKRCQMWNETLDKMIWSFQQIALEDYDSQYHHGKGEYDWIKSDKQYPNPITGKMEATYQMVDKNPDEHWYDHVGHKLHEDRSKKVLNCSVSIFETFGIDMNSFTWTNVVKSLDPALKQRMLDRKKITVNRKDYEVFCKEFVFDSIKGIGFGEAFCKRFGIDDSAISILKTEGFAKELIRSLGYIEK